MTEGLSLRVGRPSTGTCLHKVQGHQQAFAQQQASYVARRQGRDEHIGMDRIEHGETSSQLSSQGNTSNRLWPARSGTTEIYTPEVVAQAVSLSRRAMRLGSLWFWDTW